MPRSAPLLTLSMSDKRYYVNQVSSSQTMGHAIDLRHEDAALGADRHVIEPGPSTLLHLPGFGHEVRARRHRRHEADGHAQRHRGIAVGIAGGAEGDVG